MLVKMLTRLRQVNVKVVPFGRARAAAAARGRARGRGGGGGRGGLTGQFGTGVGVGAGEWGRVLRARRQRGRQERKREARSGQRPFQLMSALLLLVLLLLPPVVLDHMRQFDDEFALLVLLARLEGVLLSKRKIESD